MELKEKLFQWAGHRIRVQLEAPWTFKALTSAQVELVQRLRRGEDIGIIPVPADRTEGLAVNEELMGKEMNYIEKLQLDYLMILKKLTLDL